MFQVRTTPSHNGQVLEWNGMEWKGNDEWRYLKWHRDISKLAPFSIGRGTSTGIRIRIGTSIYHPSNHGPKYESRGKRIPGWLAGWSLEIFVGTREFLLYSVLLPLPISYGLWPPLSRCISINSGYMPSTDPFEQEGRLGMDPVCLLGLDHACMHDLACIFLDRSLLRSTCRLLVVYWFTL